MSAPAIQSRPTAAAVVETAPLATSVVIAVVASSFLLTGLSGANNFGITCLMPKLALWSPLSSYYRVWTSWMSHGSFVHVLLNVLAFGPMASALERTIGTVQFAALFIAFAHVGAVIHVLAAGFLWFTLDYYSSLMSCSIGMSGIVFSLIVCETNVNDVGQRSVFGLFEVSSAWYPVALLVTIQLIMPGVSFLGHASGIVAGYLYVKGYLNLILLSSERAAAIEQSAIAPLTRMESFVSGGHNAHPNQDANANIFPRFTSPRNWQLPVFGTPTSHAANSNARVTTANVTAFSGEGRKLGGQGSTTGGMVKEVAVDERKFSSLVEMGFDSTDARRALQVSEGDMTKAMQVLTDAQGQGDDDLV
jgi:membrane associated rhomboid family serine protease